MPPQQYRALQESLCLDEPIRLRAPREHFIELRFTLLEVARRGGVHRLLNPDALDRRWAIGKAERLRSNATASFHPALFGIDRRERSQCRHAPPAIECHRANRERSLEEFPGALRSPSA